MAKKRKIIVGVFLAIHTFGRDLKRNIHIDLSVTLGGLSEDLLQWKPMFFHQATLMRIWRYQIVSLFRKMQPMLIIPTSLKAQLGTSFSFNKFLDRLYQKTWIVDCAKPSPNFKKTLSHLSRYTKHPPITESKLREYYRASKSSS